MKILILEDDTILLKALVHCFSGSGHLVFPAVTGTEALGIVADNRDIDLIIADVMVPEVSGPTFILMLKKYFGKKIPKIIVISSISDGEDFMNKLDIPYDQFMHKPIDFTRLKLLSEEITVKH